MVKQVSAVKEDTIQAIKDGQPSLVGNMIVINAVWEEMLTNNDKCNASMLAAARRLVLEAHDQLDTLIALKKELQVAINRPSWSTFFCSDVRRTSDIMADIDVILNLLSSGKR